MIAQDYNRKCKHCMICKDCKKCEECKDDCIERFEQCKDCKKLSDYYKKCDKINDNFKSYLKYTNVKNCVTFKCLECEKRTQYQRNSSNQSFSIYLFIVTKIIKIFYCC